MYMVIRYTVKIIFILAFIFTTNVFTYKYFVGNRADFEYKNGYLTGQIDLLKELISYSSSSDMVAEETDVTFIRLVKDISLYKYESNGISAIIID